MTISTLWPRAIILMDLDAFFASIEQLDNPQLRSKPVAVTNGENGSCIITCSYEARKYGIKTGMRLKQARQLCPDLIQCSSRPNRYSEISKKIMASLTNITPDIEIFSIDEAFLDITNCQRLHGSPLTIAKMVKQSVYQASGLTCSVGVSGDKTTAKYAAKLQKPNGLTVIHPSRSEQVLSKINVTDLCGIGEGIGRFLATHGVIKCGDMKNIPKQVLQKRFGPLGERIWFMAQGLDPLPVKQVNAPPKSVGHGKVVPPNTTDHELIKTYFRHMSEKVAARLRRYSLVAKKYYIALRVQSCNNKIDSISLKLSLEQASNDGYKIYNLCLYVIKNYWQGQGVWQVQVTALDPRPADEQQDLFNIIDEQNIVLNNIIDTINTKYGSFTLQPATLLSRSEAPDVIAPSWQPQGVRDSIK